MWYAGVSALYSPPVSLGFLAMVGRWAVDMFERLRYRRELRSSDPEQLVPVLVLTGDVVVTDGDQVVVPALLRQRPQASVR